MGLRGSVKELTTELQKDATGIQDVSVDFCRFLGDSACFWSVEEKFVGFRVVITHFKGFRNVSYGSRVFQRCSGQNPTVSMDFRGYLRKFQVAHREHPLSTSRC